MTPGGDNAGEARSKKENFRMSKRYLSILLFSFALLVTTALSQTAIAPLAQRIAHYDFAKNRPSTAVHSGAGGMQFGNLVDVKNLTGNWIFFQRGALNAHSSIGEHYHNRCEEMFIILDGEAEFTIDSHTSLIKGPAAVPDRMGHAHAIYNPTDKPVQWMNVNVGLGPNYDAFNLGDGRVGATLDAIPQFPSLRFDRSLLRPAAAMDGGKGTAQYRRGLEPTIFSTTWSYVDHLLIPPGATVGARTLPNISEIYYVMAGEGTVTVNGESAPIRSGDGIPVDINQSRSFTQTGSEPLEFLIVGVAKDMDSKIAFMNAPPPARGGQGASGRGAGAAAR
jgi:mannose-6-phosphate isomerase-like protein (cupin superfamily)